MSGLLVKVLVLAEMVIGFAYWSRHFLGMASRICITYAFTRYQLLQSLVNFSMIGLLVIYKALWDGLVIGSGI